jgi:FtsP/CotA-like multicopper oxidase with cupredoxin domain
VNALDEPTIVHWHGLVVPEIADGHARRAIDAGATFDYEFDVVQRAGTYWYHLHVHHFRVLNASHARLYRLGFGDARSLTVIRNDGGLLPAPVEASEVWLGVGERVDFVVDFRDVPVGTRLALRSLPFTVPFWPTVAHPQGIAMELLELTRVAGETLSEPVLPAALSTVPRLTPADPGAVRTFTFRSSAHDRHFLDSRAFDMADITRVDYRIALGRTERWRFFNDSLIAHPVHLHGTHFQVVSRAGGRERVSPYEGGWKDTVLVMPLETVEVLVRFERYAGVFPLHCHNLQHEDKGMMVNVEVG